MSLFSRLKYLHLAYFSKPASERRLYRGAKRAQVRSIVEIGIGDGHRAIRLIDMAIRQDETPSVLYTGIDLFEAHPLADQGTLSLKDAHRLLSSSGARVKLIPGDPFQALARTANSLVGTDLIIISADHDQDSLDRAWFYIPRLLHAGSVIFWETPSEDEAAENQYRVVVGEEIQRRAAAFDRRRAA